MAVIFKPRLKTYLLKYHMTVIESELTMYSALFFGLGGDVALYKFSYYY